MKLSLRPILAVLTVAVLGVGPAVMPVGPGVQEASALVASDCGTLSFAGGTASVSVAGDTCFIDFTIPGTISGQGTWVVPAGVTSVDYLLVGGGGGGGGGNNPNNEPPFGGGGGGAGGFLEVQGKVVQPGETLTIAVGAGGAGGTAGGRGSFGGGSSIKRGNTVIDSVNPGGGGAGGASGDAHSGATFASGGGGSKILAGGSAGVLGSNGGSGVGSLRGGGGGGGGFDGAGSNAFRVDGTNTNIPNDSYNGGSGGGGSVSSIFGTNDEFAAGGGGGAGGFFINTNLQASGGSTTAGKGGLFNNPTVSTPGSGSGGGGGSGDAESKDTVAGTTSYNGGAGASGRVFLKFNVVLATKLAIETDAPASAGSGAILSPNVVIQVQDQGSAVVSSASSTVTASLVGSPADVTLSGDVQVNAVNGVATFSNLTITGPVGNYTLEFTSPNLVTATSGVVALSAGAAAGSTSVISVSPASIAANGTSTSTVTVQLKDSAGNDLTSSGGTVVLATDRGELSAVTNVGDGTYTAILTSSTSLGTARITGTINGTAITGDQTVEFTPDPAFATDSYLSLDGVDDYLLDATSPITDGANFTMEAWVYDDNTTIGQHALLWNGEGSNLEVGLFTNKQSSSNQLYLQMHSTSGAVTYTLGYQLPQREWVHLALARQGRVWEVHVNGVKVAVGDYASGVFYVPEFRVGRWPGATPRYWKGHIDQVKLWDYKLSTEQVVTSMHSHGAGGITGGASAPDLLAHYDFNTPSTATVVDSVGSNDLSVFGSIPLGSFVDVKTETTVAAKKVFSFPRSYLTAYGGWVPPSGAPSTVDYLVVGGGGAGGGRPWWWWNNGGGGAGGFREATLSGVSSSEALSVTVGQGGFGVLADAWGIHEKPTSGQSSTLQSITSLGGALGGWGQTPINTQHGSGGGADSQGAANLRAETATPGQGNNGGTAMGHPSNAYLQAAGGGGGAGSVGGNAQNISGAIYAGAGGAGKESLITGSSVFYAGGGGGGKRWVTGGSGAGGVGGGGAGGQNSLGVSAVPNTGGGGGGGGDAGGGHGGSGIIVVSYELFAAPTLASQPASVTKQTGEAVSFSVGATNASSFQWQVSTTGGGTWENISGATSATYSFTAEASQDGYQYRLVATNAQGSDSASVTSQTAVLTVQDGATVAGAFCDGSYTKNGLTIEAGHGPVFYIDTGQGQEIDAGYLAYRVKSTTGRSDLWVEVTDFQGGVVSLANATQSTQPVGTVTTNTYKASYFMIKAQQSTKTPQSHLVKVYAQKPTIGDPTPLYTCGFTFVEVQQTIKAAANKVQSITTSSVSKIGSTLTITVLGDSGTIGQGNKIDNRMIYLTPAARSNWPTDALRLEDVTFSTYSNSQRTQGETVFTNTLRINDLTGMSSATRQYYRAVYTFRIMGPAASTAPIIPIAMISSGTQVKHTDVGSLPTGSNSIVDITSPGVDLAVTKSVSPTTSVNADGTTVLDYTITLTNSGTDSLVVDELVDTPDSELTYLAGSSEMDGQAIADPGAYATSSLAYSGPITVGPGATKSLTYQMTFETCAVGSGYDFDNTATARLGTVIIGSGSATQSAVTIVGNCGEADATVTVIDEPIPPTATTGGALDVTRTTATITGVVDPNSQSGLPVRFVYGTSATLTGATPENLQATTFSSTGYGVELDLISLTAGETYYYRLEVQDADGAWVLGEIRSFTAVEPEGDPVANPPEATTVSANPIASTTATLNGDVNPKSVPSGVKVRFEWVKGTVSGSTCTQAANATVSSSGALQSELSPDPPATFEDAVLTGNSVIDMSYTAGSLTDNTPYCYRIVATHGTSFTTDVAGDWQQFTTSPNPPEPQVLRWITQLSVLAAGDTATIEAKSYEVPSPPGATPTVLTGLNISTYVSNTTDVCTVSSPTNNQVVVTAASSSTGGVCSITATQAGDASYYPATPITLVFPIQPPVVTAQVLVTTEYRASGYTQTLRATGGDGSYGSWAVVQNSGSLPAGLSLDATTGVISGTTTTAGVFTFSVTTTSNNVVSAPRQFTIIIRKKPVTVTASSPSVVFGSTTPTVSATYSGFVGADQSTVSSGDNVAPTCTSDYVIGQNAGETAVSTCSAGWHKNYVYSYVTGIVTVTKFPVTVTALDAVKQNLVDGNDAITVQPDPELRFVTSSPLPNGQIVADVIPGGVTASRALVGTPDGADPKAGLTWSAGEAPGVYPITLSGAAGDNYEVTYVEGTLTIQTPKTVPVFATIADKEIDRGDAGPASTVFAPTVGPGTIPGNFTYSYTASNGDVIDVTDLSGLPAGLYLITVTFTPTNPPTTIYPLPVNTTAWLTVNPTTVTITAVNKSKFVDGVDPELTYTVSPSGANLSAITISREPGETGGSYAITASGGSTTDFQVVHIPATFYISGAEITTTQSKGVLTSKTVQANCQGAKPGEPANFVLKVGNQRTTIATTVVGPDGRCPMSAVLAADLEQGTHELLVETRTPLDADLHAQRRFILLAASITPATDPGGDSPGNRRNQRTPTPFIDAGAAVIPGPGRLLPGNRPVTPLGQNVSPQQTNGGTLRPPADSLLNTSTGQVPRLPGQLAGPANLEDPAQRFGTVDRGAGVEPQQGAAPTEQNTNGTSVQTSGQGVRSVEEMRSERLGGFSPPGSSTLVEILGARTGARFVLTDSEVVDSFALIRAIESSIPSQASDFFALSRIGEGQAPPAPNPLTDTQRAAVQELFAASGLSAPLTLSDIDLGAYSTWLQVSGSAQTYAPGTVVYLTVTSEPLIIGSAVVDERGFVEVAGSFPADWLEAGEHRIRLVGIRALEGVTVDDEGEIQLSDDLMSEIQRFDLGTQSTIAVIGTNADGGTHTALRVVPLVPEAPWWTLWFILAGFLVVGTLRYRGLLFSRSRKISGGLALLVTSVPAVVLGWLSTVTAVVWWGLGLGLLAVFVSWFVPQRSKEKQRGGEQGSRRAAS